MDSTSVVSLLIAGLSSSVITNAVNNWANRRKLDADASKVSAEADKVEVDAADLTVAGTIKWAEAMRQDILRLTQQINDIQLKYNDVIQENFKLQLRITQLEADLKHATSST